jgi:hypothetical protein
MVGIVIGLVVTGAKYVRRSQGIDIDLVIAAAA